MADPTYLTSVSLRNSYIPNLTGGCTDGTYIYCLATLSGTGQNERIYRVRASDLAIVGQGGTVYTDPDTAGAYWDVGVTWSGAETCMNYCNGELVFVANGYNITAWSTSTMTQVSSVLRRAGTAWSRASVTDGNQVYFYICDADLGYVWIEKFTTGSHAYSTVRLTGQPYGLAQTLPQFTLVNGDELWAKIEGRKEVMVISKTSGAWNKYQVYGSDTNLDSGYYGAFVSDGTYVWFPYYQYIQHMRLSDKAFIKSDGTATTYTQSLTSTRFGNAVYPSSGLVYGGLLIMGCSNVGNLGLYEMYNSATMENGGAITGFDYQFRNTLLIGNMAYCIGDTSIFKFNPASSAVVCPTIPPCVPEANALLDAPLIAEADFNAPPIPTGAGAKVT